MMDEKFPLGYDVNAYIDKAFEQMKADFPWVTRDMIAEHTYYGIINRTYIIPYDNW